MLPPHQVLTYLTLTSPSTAYQFWRTLCGPYITLYSILFKYLKNLDFHKSYLYHSMLTFHKPHGKVTIQIIWLPRTWQSNSSIYIQVALFEVPRILEQTLLH